MEISHESISISQDWDMGTYSSFGDFFFYGRDDGSINRSNLKDFKTEVIASLDAKALAPIGMAADKTIFVADYNGKLVCLNPDGQVRWEKQYPDRIKKQPVTIGDLVLVSVRGRGIDALRQMNGELVWTLPCGKPACSSRPLVVAGDKVYTAGFGEQVVCISASDGKIVWSDSVSSFTHSPLAMEGNTLVAGFDKDYQSGFLKAYDATTGKVLLDFPIRYNGQYPAVIRSGIACFSTNKPSVVALDLAKGSIVWEYDSVDGPIATAPAILAERLLLAGTSGRYFLGLDLSSGEIKLRINSDYGIGQPYCLEGGEEVIFPTGRGDIHRFGIKR
jgi:outer membrane protein assembly factor BamB